MKENYKIIKIFIIMLCILFIGNYSNVVAVVDDNTVTINSTTLNFNRVIYVDGTKGSDVLGNGTSDNPYASIGKAQGAAVDGNAIYIREGIYDLSYTTCGLIENSHNISFIGEPGKTVIYSDGTKHSGRDNHAAVFEKDCKIYNIIFKVKFGNRSSNYSRAFVGSGHMIYNMYGKFYNCVFEALDKTGCLCYANGNIYTEFNNCSFVVPDSLLGSYCYYGSDYTKCKNCSINKSFSSSASKSACISNVSYSAEGYKIISSGWQDAGLGEDVDGTQADIGVYGGEFAWGRELKKGSLINLENNNSNVKIGDNVQLDVTVDNTKDIKSESVIIKYNTAMLDFINIDKVDGARIVRCKKSGEEINIIITDDGNIDNESLKKLLCKINFKVKSSGKGLVEIKKASISTYKNTKRNLDNTEFGNAIILCQ